jgi:hypothetical protein
VVGRRRPIGKRDDIGPGGGGRSQLVGVDMAKREDELHDESQQAEPRAAPPPRSPPIHASCAPAEQPNASPFGSEARRPVRLFCGLVPMPNSMGTGD